MQSEEGGNQAMAAVAQGALIVKATNEQMAAMARVDPRKMATVKAELLEDLETFPGMASQMFYSIPFKKRYKDGDEWRSRTEYVEGPSINAAQMIVNAFGNATVTARYDEMDDDHAIVVGVFTDLQRNVRMEAPLHVSRLTKFQGKIRRLDDDRWHLAMAAAVSKAMRNAILRGVPRPLIEVFVERAKVLARSNTSGDMSNTERMIKAFAEKGVDAGLLKRLFEVSDLSKITTTQRDEMRGMYAALKDGELTVDLLKASVGDDDAGQSQVEEAPLAEIVSEGEAGEEK